MECKNCDKPLALLDGRWVHQNTGLEACSILISGRWAEPKEA